MAVMNIIDIYIIVLFFVTGLFISKVMIIIGFQLPLKKRYISLCSCLHDYRVRELLPVYSFFKTKNKCPYCGKKLPNYLIILELLSAFFYSLSYILYGFSYEMIALIIICNIFTIIMTSDIQYYVINNIPVIVCSVLILLFKWLFWGFTSFYLALASGVIIYAIMYVLRIFGNYLFKQDSLGGGDVKLSFFFGVCLGVKLGLLAIILGALLSFPRAIYYSLSKSNREIPFGPYLISALLVVFLFQNAIISFINLII